MALHFRTPIVSALPPLLLIAGIDTTANTLAASLWYLGQDIEMQETSRAEPARIQTAVDEFLRFFTPVSISRIVRCPAQVGGTTMPADHQVLFSLPSANRDEEKFEQADSINPDRLPNPHVAFGGGIHHCLGAHIARSEMRVCWRNFSLQFRHSFERYRNDDVEVGPHPRTQGSHYRDRQHPVNSP